MLRRLTACVCLSLLVGIAACGPRDGSTPGSRGASDRAAQPELGADPVGKRAPSFTRASVVNKLPVRLPAPSRPTFLYFWATWGAPDIKALPWLETIHRRFGPHGLAVIAVSYDLEETTDDAVRGALTESGVSFPVVRDRDREISRHYHPPADPSLFLIDARGNVERVIAGYRESDDAALEAAAADLIGRRDARP